MSIEIPWTRIAGLGLRPTLATTTQEGSLGGADLTTPRVGDRYAADISTTQLKQDADARLLIAALTEGLTVDVRILLNLPTQSAAGLSDGLTAGSGQTGSVLNVRAMDPAHASKRGDFFHILHGGLRYVHMLTADASITNAGTAALAIWPMLRFVSTDADAVVFSAPMIEGRLVGFDPKGARWTRNRTEPLEFSIMERR